MAQVALAFLNYAKGYYGDTTELKNFRLAARPISDLYSGLQASKFGPKEFRACRAWWLSESTRTRQYINAQMKRLTHIIKWAVGNDLVPVSVHQSIKCVETLKRGRVSAPEAKPILPVDDETVVATIAHLTPVVRDMVKLQMATGMRPGEVCSIKPQW